MNDLALLQAAAFKAELAASRRLSERTGMPEALALHATLSLRAGTAGLECLLAERQAARKHAEQRAAARQGAADAARARRAGAHGARALWQAWFDGSARPNPGRCSIGALLEGPGGQRIELSQHAGHGDSSEAEYRALIAVLQAAVLHGAMGVAIHGDSQVVVDDANGPDSASAPALRPYRAQVRSLLARLPGATLRWVPRHKNQRADALSQRAFDSPDMDIPA